MSFVIQKQLTVDKLVVYISSISLFKSVTIGIDFFNNNAVVEGKYYTISGKDYDNWSTDDGYVVNLALKCLNADYPNLDTANISINNNVVNLGVGVGVTGGVGGGVGVTGDVTGGVGVTGGVTDGVTGGVSGDNGVTGGVSDVTGGVSGDNGVTGGNN